MALCDRADSPVAGAERDHDDRTRYQCPHLSHPHLQLPDGDRTGKDHGSREKKLQQFWLSLLQVIL